MMVVGRYLAVNRLATFMRRPPRGAREYLVRQGTLRLNALNSKGFRRSVREMSAWTKPFDESLPQSDRGPLSTTGANGRGQDCYPLGLKSLMMTSLS